MKILLILSSILISFFASGQVFEAPIKITQGGVYSGNWESKDSNTPAVIVSTTEPVTIEYSEIKSAGNLIQSTITGARITIRNTKGYGTLPTIAGKARGKFLYAENFYNVLVENCYLEHTSGIKFLNYRGNKTSSETIKVLKNRVKNIDGRDNQGGDSPGFVCFVQYDKCHNLSGSEIAWNEVINEYGNSLVQDNINMYKSSGTASSPILIHDNYIDGAYNLPSLSNSGYAGGGIICDRAWDYVTRKTTAYVKIYNNHVVRTNNYSIAIAGGNNNEIFNNRVICSNLTSGGEKLKGNGDVGIYVYNMYYAGINSATGKAWGDAPPDVYFNNKAYGNEVGYQRQLPSSIRSDYYFPKSECTHYGNIKLSGKITRALEDAEYINFTQKVALVDIKIGPIQRVFSIDENSNHVKN